ncbi:hypothetical protein AWZ03_009721 [Drosophila navojoa]|uniref:Uncharacterized protein n=1 Tax=Drosophila navojoa TaxID=7232 RepID=A0A484B4R9_DRONA|nr:hypothetical protein AWZ03_009721 [Drosophila navojoa]
MQYPWTARRITTAPRATTTNATTTIMAMATMSQLKCQTKGDDGNGIDSYGYGDVYVYGCGYGCGYKNNEIESELEA